MAAASGIAALFCASLASAQTPATGPATPAAEHAAPLASHTVNAAPQERREPPQEERHWYGWQALAVDGAAAALGLGGLALLSSDDSQGYEERERLAGLMALGGAVAYGVGAPAIHLLHQRPWQALGSLGLRAGLPVLGGAVGLGAATCPPATGDYGNCGLPELLMGAIAGTLVAVALDASLLAWDSPRSDAPTQGRLGIAPVVSSDGRRELRVFGTF